MINEVTNFSKTNPSARTSQDRVDHEQTRSPLYATPEEAATSLQVPADELRAIDQSILQASYVKGEDSSYQLKRYLGHGRIGVVFEAETIPQSEETKPQKVAVKMLRTQRKISFSAMSDLAVFYAETRTSRLIAETIQSASLSQDKVAHIARILESFEDGDTPVIIMEFLNRNHNILAHLKGEDNTPEQESQVNKITEHDLAQISIQALNFLSTIHSVGICYSDFKFENLWWDPDKCQLTLSDFNVTASTSPEGELQDFSRLLNFVIRIILGGNEINFSRFIKRAEYDQLSQSFKDLLNGWYAQIQNQQLDVQKLVTQLETIMKD